MQFDQWSPIHKQMILMSRFFVVNQIQHNAVWFAEEWL